MATATCLQCGAILPPEVNFCRQCGAAVSSSSQVFSESPTIHLSQADENTATRRLHPRSTTPGPGRLPLNQLPTTSAPDLARGNRKRPAAILVLALVLCVALAAAGIALLRTGHRVVSNVQTTTALIYPGSQTVLDTTTDGARAIQLQTSDSVDQVVAWYTTNIKPTKTVRLGSSTVVLRSQNVTVTIAGTDNKTTILIKQGSL